ncbi:hypothetical protein BpHYR1_019040, partial [Brachionus plicatilis]
LIEINFLSDLMKNKNLIFSLKNYLTDFLNTSKFYDFFRKKEERTTTDRWNNRGTACFII